MNFDKIADEVIIPILLFALLLTAIILAIVFVAELWCDSPERRANLMICADKYRSCVHENHNTCLQDFSVCRGKFSTGNEEWAIVLGSAESMPTISAKNSARAATSMAAAAMGMSAAASAMSAAASAGR